MDPTHSGKNSARNSCCSIEAGHTATEHRFFSSACQFRLRPATPQLLHTHAPHFNALQQEAPVGAARGEFRVQRVYEAARRHARGEPVALDETRRHLVHVIEGVLRRTHVGDRHEGDDRLSIQRVNKAHTLLKT